jgi:hypothetical protein
MSNITIKIEYDSDPMNPRTDWDNAGTMVCFHSRYNLGDEQPKGSASEYRKDLPKGTLWLPLYLYDHSGITMSTGSFSCGWDSGCVGFIYVTPETIAKEWGGDREAAKRCLEAEVKVYDDYLTGAVFGYTIHKANCCDSCGHNEPEEIDSCWGFYGHDDALEGMKGNVDPEYHKALEEAWHAR